MPQPPYRTRAGLDTPTSPRPLLHEPDVTAALADLTAWLTGPSATTRSLSPSTVWPLRSSEAPPPVDGALASTPHVGMVISMASSQKVTVTLPVESVQAIRELVAEAKPTACPDLCSTPSPSRSTTWPDGVRCSHRHSKKPVALTAEERDGPTAFSVWMIRSRERCDARRGPADQLDRGRRQVIALLALATERGGIITIPGSALAQAIRDPARQARLARLVRQPRTCVVPLDKVDATNVGRLLAASGTSDIADAHVVVCGRRPDDNRDERPGRSAGARSVNRPHHGVRRHRPQRTPCNSTPALAWCAKDRLEEC